MPEKLVEKIGGNLSAPTRGNWFSPKPPLMRTPAEDLIAISLGMKDLDNPHLLLRQSIEQRRIIAPSRFNPAYCGSLACKRVRKHAVKQKTPLVWDLPGHGKFGNGCGQISGVISCPQVHRPKPIFDHCWSPGCPHCSWDTTMRKGAEIGGRLNAYDHLRPRSPNFQVKQCWQHVSISPPQKPAKNLMGSLEGYKHLKDTAIEILRQHLGAVGGVLVFHPFRQNGEDDYNNKLTTGNTGNINDWRTAPHFHAIVMGFFNPDQIKDIHTDSGWVVHSIRAHLDENDRLATSCYVMTHAGVGSVEGRRNLQSYSYFGELTTAHLQYTADTETEVVPPCEDCNKPQYLVKFSHGCRMPTSYEQYHTTQKGRIYCLKEDRAEVEDLLEHSDPSYLPHLLYFHAGLFYATDTAPDEVWLRGRKRPRIQDEFGPHISSELRGVCSDHAAMPPRVAACSGQTDNLEMLGNSLHRPYDCAPAPIGGIVRAGNMGEALSSFASPPAGGGRWRKGGDYPPPPPPGI